MSDIIDQVRKYIESPVFKDLLRHLIQALIGKGLQHALGIIDEKLKELSIPCPTRIILAWSLTLGLKLLFVWFLGSSLASTVLHSILEKLVPIVIKIFYPNESGQLESLISDKQIALMSIEPEKLNKVTTTLLEEIRSDDQKNEAPFDHPDYQKSIEILEKIKY